MTGFNQSAKPTIKLKYLALFSTLMTLLGLILLTFFSLESAASRKETLALPQSTLLDKIRGGWTGQLLGCALGIHYEHKFQSNLIPETTSLSWTPELLASSWRNNPDLYDDLFLDLLFLDIIGKKGLKASSKDLASTFRRTPFLLHHGLQMARHNLLIGLKPPKTGHWLNNPHADDNDFQKAADFIGLISPGMIKPVIKLGQRLGHIISFGDGYYGGIYIASLYSLAFVYDKPESLIKEALKIFPPKASFAQVITDVLENYRRFPDDWKKTWEVIQKKWGQKKMCPESLFRPLNCDGKANSAWITIGLLYGHGDFGRTLEITVRCGDDTDSNAAAAGGIVGTLLGFSQIPADWKKGLKEIEILRPKGLGLSIEEAKDLSFQLALEMIKKNGGKMEGDNLFIPRSRPSPLPYEVNFPNHFPKERRELNLRLSEINSETIIEFEGTGFAINGRIVKKVTEDHTYRVALVVDGRLLGAAILPAHPWLRNPTPFFRFNLRPGKHRLFLQISEPSPKADIQLDDLVIYDKKPSSQDFNL